MPRPVVLESRLFLPFEPERLWPFVADTNRINRAIGLPAVHYARIASEAGERQTGEYRVFGRAWARWIENPFEWERPKRFSVLREYSSGPILKFYGGTELTPRDGGSDIRVFADITPRKAVFHPLIRYVLAPRQLRQASKQFQAVGAYLTRESASPFPTLAPARSQVNGSRLETLLHQLRAQDVPAELVEKLGIMVAEAPDEDVAGMRPIELAERWSTPHRPTLETFLKASVLGLLEMRWELLCPSCRGVKAAATELRQLAATGHCTACNVHFAANVDEAIEARFYPAPSVRNVSVGSYCVGGPMNTPHRLAQTLVEPGETREMGIELPPGPYVIRSPQSRGISRIRVAEAPQSTVLDISLDEDAVRPDEASVTGEALALRITNTTASSATVALDSASWAEAAATPSRLMTFPAFRALFSAEALAPGVELAVGRVGLLFTDLAGSTALYERAGDASAFRLVSEHFTVLRAAVERNGGAMIKTIGDAVMAAFPDGRQALAGALAIQSAMRTFDTRGLADPVELVKIGVHAGACFVVTLNEQLDYFGTAVNIAARAQGEARGGEIVATSAVLQEGLQTLLDARLHADAFEVTLRGLSAPVSLFRINCRTMVAPSAV